MKDHIVFFDDICVLCTWSVRFLFRNEREKNIFFASFQSDAFNEVKSRFTEISPDIQSVVYYENNRISFKSDAVLRLAGHLKFPYPLLKIGYIFPGFIRDGIYDLVARNRYKWFGKRNTCYIPDNTIKMQFLG